METVELVAVGDVMLDVAVAGAGHAARVRVRPGGSAANVAVWAAAAGARAAVVGRVGDDLPGRLLRTALGERGVEALLAVDPDLPTGSVVTTGEGIVADRGATATLAAADLPPALRAGAVVVSGYVLFRPGSEEAARAALARAEAPWVVIDVGARAAAHGPVVAAGVNAIVANEAAARELTGRDAEEAATELGRSFRLACVTRGPAGAVASLDGERSAASTPRVEEVDETGAGDAFTAGLLVALLRGAELPAALACACRFGALAASSPDTWPAAGESLRAP